MLMDNILQDIISSEQEALKIENEAKQEALNIVSEAKKKAEVIIEEAFSQGEEIAQDLLKVAKTEAFDERRQSMGVQQEADERIKAKSREKLEMAVDFIVGKVVNKSWQ